MNKMKYLGIAMGLLGSVLFASSDASASIITLHSGNGTIGGPDSAILMLIGPADAPFGSAFTAADFAAARSGPSVAIIARNLAWLSTSSFSDSSANYISTSAGGASEGATALYAIDFTVPDAVIASATINFNYVVDNFLGGGPNQGLVLNGTALSGSTSGGGFGAESSHSRNDIGGLLVSGLNTLYINATDVGGPSGLLFAATIATVPGRVILIPEPATLSLFGLGLVGLGFAARRRRLR